MKTLLIGLDGFDFNLVCQWIERGYLPNLSYLVHSGSFSSFSSLIPPVSPAVWTSILTGVNPAQHGVFDFTSFENRKVRLLCDFPRESQNIFEILSRQGVTVVSIGFPASTPVSEIRGAVLSGWRTPFSVSGGKKHCYPSSIHEEIVKATKKEKYLNFDCINQFKEISTKSVQKVSDLLTTSAIQRAYLAVTISNQILGSCDILGVYFPEADAGGHHLWHFHDLLSPRWNNMKFAKNYPDKDDPLLNVYTGIDRAVGIIIDRYNPDSLIIVSDHGMGGSGLRALSINVMLAKAGLLKLKEKLINKININIFSIFEEATLAFAGLIPPVIREKAVNHLKGFIIDDFLTSTRFGGIDWEKTLAFSEDLGYAPSIWLNFNGGKGSRRGSDFDLSDGDREQMAKMVINRILEIPEFEKLISKIWWKGDLYKGPFIHRIPDLLIEFNLDNNYSYNIIPGLFRVMKNHVEPIPARYLTGTKGRSRSGSHRKEGILIMYGRRNSVRKKTIEIYDIAPMIISDHIKTGIMHSRGNETACCLLPEEADKEENFLLVYKRLKDLGYI